MNDSLRVVKWMCGNNVFYHNGSMLGAVMCKGMVTECTENNCKTSKLFHGSFDCLDVLMFVRPLQSAELPSYLPRPLSPFEQVFLNQKGVVRIYGNICVD